MVWIAGQTLTNSSTGLIEFTSIPQGFTHIQARWFFRFAGTGTYAGVYLNNDTTSGNYYTHTLYGSGTSAVSSGLTNNQATLISGASPNSATTANVFEVALLDILDYSNTSKNKTLRWTWGWDANGSGQVGLSSAVWLSTAGINRFSFNGASAFAAGSRVDLYGFTSSQATGA
jgi:hypothetical protein